MAKKTDKQMSKGKKALNVALIVIQVAIVIVAIAFSISILLSTGYESNTDFGKSSIRLMPVLTDSMAGDKEDSFKAGDLIIVKSAEKVNVNDLQEGDIVTYLDYVGSDLQFVTHRIVSKSVTTLADGTEVAVYETMGDAETSGITKTLYSGDIKGVYVGKLAGVGSVVFWLQDPTHFFLVIMLPLILLLLYNAYIVVRLIIDYKLKKQREQLAVATTEGSAPLDEEEIKRRAIEEYLKSQGIAPAAAAEQEKTEDPAAEESGRAEDGEPTQTEAQAEGSEEKVTEEIPARTPAEEKSGESAEETAEEAPAEEQAATPAEETAQKEVTEAENAPEAESAEQAAPAEKEEQPAAAEKKPAKKPAAKKTASGNTTAKGAAQKKPAAKTAAKTSAKSGTATSAKTATKKPAAKKTTKKTSE